MTLLSENPLFIGAGASQPARRDFGIAEVLAGGVRAPVHSRDAVVTPFCTLLEFCRSGITPKADFLVVAPLSGHFPILLRDLVLGLLPDFRVYVTDWLNVRHIPIDQGPFGLESNIACVLDIMKKLPPGLNVIALCQAGVPAFAATALLASNHDPHTPASLTLIAAPIDPLANPTHVVQLLRSRPLSWFETNVITAVPKNYPGSGRYVYPAHLHLIRSGPISQGASPKAAKLHQKSSLMMEPIRPGSPFSISTPRSWTLTPGSSLKIREPCFRTACFGGVLSGFRASLWILKRSKEPHF